MEELRMKAEVRMGRGKGPARRIRKEGSIPAVLYGKDIEPAVLSISAKEWRTFETRARSNAIIKMELSDGGSVQERPVMVKNVQKAPADYRVLHVDFLQVSMERVVQVEVPIHFSGIPEGVTKGGVVEQHLRSVMVETLPGQIPEKIDIDITRLEIGDSIHIHEISIPGVKLLDPPDVAIVGVTPPQAETKVEAAGAVTEESTAEKQA